MVTNAESLVAVHTHTHTHTHTQLNVLTNRLEISSLNLVCNKQRRLGRHTKSMFT